MPLIAVIRAVALCLGLWAAAAIVHAEPARSGGLLHDTLAGEYALQAGKLDDAARWYLDAAMAAEGDAGMAERAARIALLAKDDARAAQALRLWSKRAPESLAMRAAAATLALRQNDARTARRTLEALMRQRQPVGWPYALSALGSGVQPALSARILGDLVRADAIPNELRPWLVFGGLAQRLDDTALSERMVQQVVRRFPDEPEAALLRVSQLRQADQREQARAALDALAKSGRVPQRLRLSLAAEYEALGDLTAAAAVLAEGPQDDRSYALRASLLDRAEDKDTLGKLYDELKPSAAQPDPMRRLLLGQVAESLKRHEEALQWYQSVPGGVPRWRAQLRIPYVLHALKRVDEAHAALRKLQTNAAAGDETRRNAYLAEAELHAEDDPASAQELDAYARGLAAFPDDSAILYARALSFERRDDIPRAEADLRKILVAEPDNTAALNALGYTLADRTTRYQEALELISRARAADPENAAIIDSYGWVLYRLGRHREALAELKRAYALQKDAEIAAHVGEVLWVLGQTDEAAQWFEQARKIDPDNRSLKRALEKTGA